MQHMFSNMFIYTKNTLDLLKTLKTSIYIRQNTPKTPNNIFRNYMFPKSVFSKVRHSKESVVYADFYDTIYIVEGHTA